MYQVMINDKYYVSDVVGQRSWDLIWSLYGYETTSNKYKSMFFEYEIEAQSIAEQVCGKVIEYVEKKDVQIEVKCNVDLEEVYKQLAMLRNE